MFDQRSYYLIEYQYLGFRYHGYQRQPNVKTVQLMLERTLNYVLEDDDFKILPSGRTDAMVSANHAFLELFLKKEIADKTKFLERLNYNLPSDIRALSIEEVDAKFNVIQSPKNKEYIYLFSFGEKNHPFAAPYICHIPEVLDIALMQKAAALFVGEHDFINYVYKPSDKTITKRRVEHCEIKENDIYTASFFPEQSFAFVIKGNGFMRHQIRLMVGALIDLGRGVLSLEDFECALKEKRQEAFTFIAPASGLILNAIEISQS